MNNANENLRRGRNDAVRIDALADEFERAIKAGQSPRIEEFLDRVDESARLTAMRELLKVEIELRRDGTGRDNLRQSDVHLATVDHNHVQPGTDDRPTRAHHDSDTGSGRLEVRCPGCHAPTEVAVDTSLTDLTCGSCGSHFSLVDQSKATRMAPSLTKMGRFDLIERIGVGAFGSVWKARDKELDRTVAIKIPRAGGMTGEEQEKFFREARAAAQLHHPSIVSVHEVGRDGDNVYIVSDFVRGVTLGDWLTGQQLTSREVAELCAKIADALHHAHEQGVVHRDLKPANIMMDYEGRPHLMDFGLARRETGEVTMTMEGQVLGTPAYMSPEQAQGEAHTADRRSDVYSLGVILFQLLTGELPFRGNARMLIKQVITDEPPSPRKLNGNVKRDLETITLKCLDKIPARRYQTARELAEELRRFLAGEPIHARPISQPERIGRWIRRNKAVSALSSAVILALVGGITISTYFAVDAGRTAETAIKREKEAQAVTTFLVESFASLNPYQDGSITVAQFIDRTEERLNDVLLDQPATRAAILDAIGMSRIGLGFPDRAIKSLESARRLNEKALGPENSIALSSMENLAAAYRSVGRVSEAIQIFEITVKSRKARLGDENAETISSMNSLASAYHAAGRLEEAVSLFEYTLKQRSRILGAAHRDTLTSMSYLANAYITVGRIDEATRLHEKTFALRKEHLGTNHLDTLRSMSSLCRTYLDTGQENKVVEMSEVVVNGLRDKLGPDHPDTLTAMGTLGIWYENAGKAEKAIALCESAFSGLKKAFGPEHRFTYWAMRDLASAYRSAGRIDEAILLYSKAIAGLQKQLGPDHAHVLHCMAGLALANRQAGHMDIAISIREQILTLETAKYGEDHPETLKSRNALALNYWVAGRLNDAIALHEKIIAVRRKTLGNEHVNTLTSMSNLASAYVDAGRIDEGIRLNEEVLNKRRKIYGSENRRTLNSMHALAYSYLVAGRVEEAIELSEQTLAGRQELSQFFKPDTLLTLHNLLVAYYKSGQIPASAQPAYLDYAVWRDTVQLARKGYPDLVNSAIVGEDMERLPVAIPEGINSVQESDANLRGVIKATLESVQARGDADSFMYTVYGVCLRSQSKLEQAKLAFQRAVDQCRRNDGTYDFSNARPMELTAAYFLDLIPEKQYLAQMGDDSAGNCLSWFYVAQRHDFERRASAAVDAYKRCIESQYSYVPQIAHWRLSQLSESIDAGQK